MPAYLISLEWSNGPLAFLKAIITVGLPHPVSNIMAALVCYYILLLSFGVRPYLAIAGALAFGFSSYMIIGLGAGHNTRIGAIALVPLTIAGIHLAFSGKRYIGSALTAAGLALQLRENHLQITYYLMFIVAGYALVQAIYAIREKELKSFLHTSLLLAAAVILAAATFAGPFWVVNEYSQYSMRGKSVLAHTGGQAKDGLNKDYVFEYSNGLTEPLTLLVPNILGGSTSKSFLYDENSHISKEFGNTYQEILKSGDYQTANQLIGATTGYFGMQGNTAPYYAGAIICCAFAIGIAFAKRKYLWWLLPLCILSVMLTYGANLKWFNYFMFDYMPGYNKFRSVTFALMIILFAMPLLGMLG
ncbi:MAG TPA: hypothetical protein VFS31_13670, partial [Chitinophagaceae bacterium]|nr:hypothetical protein [Chitinophagaceae bacterium]